MTLKRPKILVDLGKLADIYSGLGQVSLNFGKALQQENKDRFELTYLLPKGTETYFDSKAAKFEFLSFTRRHFAFLGRQFNLWHAIHQDSAYMPGSKNTSYLLTIHDLNFLQEKSAAKAQARLKKLQAKVNRASAVSSISQFTAKEIEQHLALQKKPTVTIYNGVEDITAFPKQRPFFLQKNEPFLFAMGVVKEKKNFHVLVDFLAALPVRYKLVLAGNKAGTYSKEIELLAELKGLKDRFVVCGTVSSSEKAYLLSHCEAFLFPSKCEGFGLPVIEAMQFGKPVFLSTYSSLPEIGGLHAFYWQHFEPQYMAAFFMESLKYFYDTPHMAAHMVDYAKTFSWQKNARQYIELYSRLLNIP